MKRNLLTVLFAFVLLMACTPTPTLTVNEYFNQASIAYEKGDLDQAIANYTKAIELNITPTLRITPTL